MKIALFSMGLFLSTFGFADWYSGTVEMIAIGYDGQTISVAQT